MSERVTYTLREIRVMDEFTFAVIALEVSPKNGEGAHISAEFRVPMKARHQPVDAMGDQAIRLLRESIREDRLLAELDSH